MQVGHETTAIENHYFGHLSLWLAFLSRNNYSSLDHDLMASIGTIHLRRQHVLEGEGCPNAPMVKRSKYIRIKNPLHKHFAGMPMVGG